MKKFLISFALFFSTIFISAQEHLSFKGISIEGSLASFCEKLHTKGFKSVDSDNKFALLTGEFIGHEVTVGVSSIEDGKNVVSVIVFFEPSNQWNSLTTYYTNFKNLYTRKYGKPIVSNENNPAQTNDNTELMMEVYQGTVDYNSIWEIYGGTIQLTITTVPNEYKAFVTIVYTNSQNFESKIQNDLEDI